MTAPTKTSGKYYRVDVEMTNGFKYSYTCIGKMLAGMMKSSNTSWIKSVKETEITEGERK